MNGFLPYSQLRQTFLMVCPTLPLLDSPNLFESQEPWIGNLNELIRTAHQADWALHRSSICGFRPDSRQLGGRAPHRKVAQPSIGGPPKLAIGANRSRRSPIE